MTLDLFCDFLQNIFNEQEISPQQMHTVLMNLRQTETRQNFIRSLSTLRQFRKLADKPFFMLTHLMRLTFYQIFVDAQNPSREAVDSDTILLINMSLTYFRMLNNNKQYPAYYLKNLQFFHTSRFWELAYRAEVSEKRLVQASVDKRYHKFDTLLIIALMAREFSVSKTDFIRFAYYVGEAHNFALNDEQINQVKQAFGIENYDDYEDYYQKKQRRFIEDQVLHEIQLGMEGAEGEEVLVGLWEFRQGEYEVL